MNSYNDPSPFLTKNDISLKAPFFLYFPSYELISACYSCFKIFFRHFFLFPIFTHNFRFFLYLIFFPLKWRSLKPLPSEEKSGGEHFTQVSACPISLSHKSP